MRTLSAAEKWAYAIGNMPYSVKDAAFVNFVVFYYTQVQGLSGTLAGLAALIAMLWDAFTDPLVGSWSDTIRSRWGRRHPPILLGGVPFALMFIPLFSPPEGMSEIGLFLWFTLVAMILRTFLTIYFIPFSAMGAELSTDYDERTVIAKARVTMGWIAGMALPAIGLGLIFQGNGDSDGRLIADNYDTYGVLSTVVALSGILICILGTRSVIDRLPSATSETRGISLQKTIADFRSALSNYNFRITVGSNLAFGMAAGVYTTLSLYLGTYFWEFSSAQLAGLVVPTAIGTLVAFAVTAHLGRRYDKAVLLAAASLGIALNIVWLIGARLLDLLPANGHPILYPLQCIAVTIGVITVAGTQIVGVSLMADILDEQEVATGQRQEGVFFAANTFIQKITMGFGSLVAGIVVDVAGIQAQSQPGQVARESLSILGWFAVTIISLLAFIAFLFATRIRLGRSEHHQLRQVLAARGDG